MRSTGLPSSGTGSKSIPPIIPQQTFAPTLPHPLNPHHERNLQFHLCDYLSQSGKCYPEVNFGDGPIDIVWVDESYEGRCGADYHRRTIGIETKHIPNASRIQLREQLQRYMSTEAYQDADFVGGQAETVSVDEYSLLDGVWLAVAGDEVYNTDSATGSIALNRWTGHLSYEFDEAAAKTLRRVPYDKYAEDEALLGLLLWQYYRGPIENPKNIVAAECRATRPQHRRIMHEQVQTEIGQAKRIDLVIGDRSYLDEFSADDDIVGLELKAGSKISDAARITEQLDTYVNSGLFSKVYLTVTQELLQNDPGAIEHILDNAPRAGLRQVALDRNTEYPSITSVRDIQPAQRLKYQAMPIVSYGGGEPSYDRASST